MARNKRWLAGLALWALGAVLPLAAQAQQGTHLVYFDHKNNTPYYTSNPAAFLSARALQRRAHEGIAVTTQDLPVDPAYVAAVEATGAHVQYALKWFNAAVVTADASQLSAVMALPFVTNGSRLALHRVKDQSPWLHNQFEPNVAGLQVAAPVQPGTALQQLQLMGADSLLNNGFDGAGKLIAVFDAGFYRTNTVVSLDSLRSSGRINQVWNVHDADTVVYDFHNHGTSVLSTMAANQPGVMLGTAPGASYALFRTEVEPGENPFELTHWARAAEMADSMGADLINSSLGYLKFSDASLDYSINDLDGRTSVISNAARFAAARGILVVTAAGNDGTNTAIQGKIGMPGDADSVMTVGAVDASGNYANFSSRGPTADGRIKPDVVAMGAGAAVTSTFTAEGFTTRSNGTSFATPIICGFAASLWQAYPQLKAQELLQLIKASGSNVQAPNSNIGWGIPSYHRFQQLVASGKAQLAPRLGVYPNPASSVMHIDQLNGRAAMAQVLDLNGRLLVSHELPAGQQQLDVSTLPQGLYILRIAVPGQNPQLLRFARQ